MIRKDTHIDNTLHIRLHITINTLHKQTSDREAEKKRDRRGDRTRAEDGGRHPRADQEEELRGSLERRTEYEHAGGARARSR
jgi:hypothetical protein